LIGDNAFVEAQDLAGVLDHKKHHDITSLLPHPLKFKAIPEEVIAAVELIEVWNRRYDGGGFIPAQNISFYEERARGPGRDVYAVGGVDFHNDGDPLDITTAVHCRSLSADDALCSLRGGSSTPNTGVCGFRPNCNCEGGVLVAGELKRAIRQLFYQVLRRMSKLPIFKSEMVGNLKKKNKDTGALNRRTGLRWHRRDLYSRPIPVLLSCK